MMVKVRAERFLDVALLNTGQLSTSYKEKKLKWIIRDHLLSLISEFPSFKLSMAPFSYDDGVTTKLLNATGVLPCFNIITITIWIPLSYPLHPPILFLSSSSSAVPIVHPYVDPSTGLVTIPYLTMWDNKRFMLTELVRNLVRIFKFSNSSTGHFRVSSLPSRREAVDRLAIHLLNDLARFNGEVKEEKDKVLIIRSRLKERAITISDMTSELNHEKKALENKAKEMEREVEKISKWLEGCNMSKLPRECAAEEVFQAIDEESKVRIDHKAAEDSVYETMRKMEEAMGKGAIPLDVYLKQVRALAVEQFYHRSMLMEVNNEARFIL